MTTKSFSADIQRLLQLIIKSLYKDTDVFLRELISNASDAIDKCRLETLENPLNENFEIVIQPDDESNLLHIRDNGIGMNEHDLIENLSTIAHSGTDDIRKKLEHNDDNLIGKFGVGFFSAFLVSQKIEIITKKLGNDIGYLWESDGESSYCITEKSDISWNHGTQITLFLKPDYKSFTNPIVLKQSIEKHSQFISYPIQIINHNNNAADPVHTISQKVSLWKKSKADCTTEQYHELFHTISNIYQNPPFFKHFSSDGGNTEFSGILFINPQPSLYGPLSNKKIRIYCNNVLVMDSCPIDIMPDWMNFVCGVIETNNLPLTVSRDTFQHNDSIKQLKKFLRKQVCALLIDFFNKDRKSFTDFYYNFSKHLKWAVNDDESRLESILLWCNSRNNEFISFEEYIKSYMTEGQKYIYYMTGNSVDDMKSSIFIKPFKKQNKCVLLLDAPIDEFLMQKIKSFKDHELVDISKEFGEDEEEDHSDEEDREFFQKIQELINDSNIQTIRYSNLLDIDDAARIISNKTGWSGHMENIMKAQPLHEEKVFELQKGKRIFEINKHHPVILKFKKDFQQQNNISVDNLKLLYNLALLHSGYQPIDLTHFTNIVYTKLIE